MRTELSSKWVRGYVGETVVVDSRAPMLFFEDSFPVPGYAFADDDVRLDLLRPTSDPPPHGPFFYLPKGPVAEWYHLEVEGRIVRHAAWRRDDPEISDRLVLSWQPGVLDRWMEEEEEVIEHPRDPHKRVEAIASSRHVEISLDGSPRGRKDRRPRGVLQRDGRHRGRRRASGTAGDGVQRTRAPAGFLGMNGLWSAEAGSLPSTRRPRFVLGRVGLSE